MLYCQWEGKYHCLPSSPIFFPKIIILWVFGTSIFTCLLLSQKLKSRRAPPFLFSHIISFHFWPFIFIQIWNENITKDQEFLVWEFVYMILFLLLHFYKIKNLQSWKNFKNLFSQPQRTQAYYSFKTSNYFFSFLLSKVLTVHWFFYSLF